MESVAIRRGRRGGRQNKVVVQGVAQGVAQVVVQGEGTYAEKSTPTRALTNVCVSCLLGAHTVDVDVAGGTPCPVLYGSRLLARAVLFDALR